MTSYKNQLLSGTVIPLAVVVGVGVVGVATAVPAPVGPAHAACAPSNPCAAKKPANPCNPCAAAKACNPCNPCAAKAPCNPCNPCAAGGGAYSSTCVVPRLRTAAANPCAAKKPCAPCAAKNPCNPCAAKNPCNPCAAKNPCNPCAAKNPCNPCAAKNPCNPCAVKNPCSPCAAKSPCAPCSPCGPAAAPELTDAEAQAAYECLFNEMQAAYAKSGHAVAVSFASWPRYSLHSYQSATHGGRYVQNYADNKAYGKFDEVGTMPVGATIAKDSFSVTGDGRLGVGPLFLMQKMPAGFSRPGKDWKYTMIMPDGTVFGETGGKNSAGVTFCMECHATAEDTDHLFFLPDEHRARM